MCPEGTDERNLWRGMVSLMMIVAPAMGQVYELLALLVALFFPAALVTWLVIDKFFVSSDGKSDAAKGRTIGCPSGRILADHPRHEA